MDGRDRRADGPFHFLTTPWGVLLAEVTYFTPFVMRPLLAAFSQLDTAQLEMASSLGARAPRIVRQVILPEALPALAAGGSLVLVMCLNEFGIVLFTGAKGVTTLPMLVYSKAILDGDYPGACVVAIVSIAMSVSLYGLYRSRWAAPRRAAVLVHSRSGRWATWTVFLVLFLPLFALPLLVILAASFATNWCGALPSGPTAHYRDVGHGDSLQALTTSLLTALAASLLALIVGLWAALAGERLPAGLRRVLDALFVLPVAVPSVVVGLAVLVAFSRPPMLLNGTALDRDPGAHRAGHRVRPPVGRRRARPAGPDLRAGRRQSGRPPAVRPVADQAAAAAAVADRGRRALLRPVHGRVERHDDALPAGLDAAAGADLRGHRPGRPVHRAALAVVLMAATLLVLLGVSRIRTQGRLPLTPQR